MKTEKSLIIKRLVIYYIIALLPLAVVTPILNHINGGPIFAVMDVTDLNICAYVMGVFGMFAPSAAVIITRLATKEGWKDSYLALNIRGNVKYYLFSVLYCVLSTVIDLAVVKAVLFPGRAFSDVFRIGNMRMFICAYLLQMISSVYIFFPAFGEEWGWRGYMMPKLLKIMPKPAAVIVGGILWGLWHAPLTVSGHNFGLDYPGYPYVGILLMCLFCTLMNTILTILTEKTKSIYPASFCHALNNNMSLGVIITLFSISESDKEIISGMGSVQSFTMILVRAVAGILIAWALTLIKKPERKPVENTAEA